jgi:uncharacterized protein (TIGR00369 family)
MEAADFKQSLTNEISREGNASVMKATTGELSALIQTSPMITFLGIKLEQYDKAAQTASFTLPMRPEFERDKGTSRYHGGAIMAFADTAGDFAVAYLVGGFVPTMNFRVDFLRPAVGGELLAKAKVRKIGKTVAVVDVEIFDLSSKLVALGRGTFSAMTV